MLVRVWNSEAEFWSRYRTCICNCSLCWGGGEVTYEYKRRADVHNAWNIPPPPEIPGALYRNLSSSTHFVFGLWSPGSLLSLGTRLRPGRSGVRILVGARDLYSETSGPALSPTQLPVKWVPAARSAGVRRAGSAVDRSPP
jgi:hypothetical protein